MNLLSSWILAAALGLPAEPASAVARSHFGEGLAAVERGDLELALREFEAAYAAQPHPSVLYNIGQARLGLGQVLPAIEAFERYLEQGGEQLLPERRQQVVRLLEVNRQRLGRLLLVPAEPARTRVWVDGVELTRERFGVAFPVVAGEHHVLYAVDSGPPLSRSIVVERGSTAELRLSTPPSVAPAELVVRCAVPAATVEVAGMPALTTPLRHPIRLTPGTSKVRFSRAGYRSKDDSVTLAAGEVLALDCALRPEEPLPPALRAELSVVSSPSDVQAFVDGQPFVRGPLPVGMHVLRVQRDGFVPVNATIVLEAGKTLHYTATLRRTAASEARWRAAAQSRRTTGVALSSAGAALLLTAGGLFLWNDQRYREWESERSASNPDRDLSRALSLQRIDDLCLGLAVLGLGAGGTGAWLLFTPPKEPEP